MDKTKIFEAAGKFTAKGQHDKAAKEYQRILEEDPKDVRALQKLAEIHQKNGKLKEATDLMLRVAEGYTEQGFFLKAVAVYKQVLKVGPERIDVNLKLAQLYQQLGLVGDATQQYQLVANHYDKLGNVKESLAALRKMVDLDPDNVASQVKLGELYARERMVAEAVVELRKAAAYLKRNNRAEDHLRVLERIGQLIPDDAAAAKELAQLFLGKGDTKRALAKLQVCFRANPKDADTLSLLAQAFSDLGQEAKTVSVYRELAHVHGEQGRTAERRKVLERILQLAPGDPEATEAMLELGGAPAAAPQVLVPPAPAAVARGPATPVGTPAPAARSNANSPAPASAAIAKVLTETDVYLKYGLVQKASEHVQKALLSEPESLAANEKLIAVYDRLGKTDEAVGLLARLVEIARRNEDFERESGYLQELGQRAPGHPLVTAAAASAELPEADDDVIISAEEELLDADPLDADPLDAEPIDAEPLEPEPDEGFEIDLEKSQPLHAPKPAGAVPWHAAEDDEDVVVEAEPLEAGVAMEELLVDESLGTHDFGEAAIAAAFEGSPPPPSATRPAPVAAPQPIDPFAIVAGDEDESDAEEVVILDEEVAHPPAAAASPWEAGDDLGLLDMQLDAPAPAEATESPAELPLLETVPALDEAPALEAPPPLDLSPLDLPPFDAAPAEEPAIAEEPAHDDDASDLFAAEFEEAEFLVHQGLAEDAQHALEAILAQAPHHARAQALLQQLVPAPVEDAPLPAREPTLPPAGQNDLFDLASELADEFDKIDQPRTPAPAPAKDEGYSVSDVLTEFKVRRGDTLSTEDSQTHYDLGMAYKEMGLYDEAIQEFEAALQGRGRRRVIDCLTMLGMCRLEKGDARGAIPHFEQALKTPGLTLEASKEAHFEIGLCLEQLGDERAALDHYARVFKADQGFRDVRQRVARLHAKVGAAKNGAPAKAARPAAAGEQPPAPPAPAAGNRGKIGYL